MLTFLRKLRRSLIESGSARKYLLYAVGEIALVVIGILIALQINNWNEWRKERAVEKELLHQFHTELNSDIKQIEYTLSVYENIINSCSVLIDHLKTKKVYNDSLNYHLAVWNDYEHFNLNSGAISNLNSRGVEIISDPELRNSILQLYNQTYTYSKDIGRHFREDHIEFTYPMYLERIEPVEWKKIAIPNDYEELMDDQEFLNHLQWIKNASTFNAAFYTEAVTEVQNVIKSIEDYVNGE